MLGVRSARAHPRLVRRAALGARRLSWGRSLGVLVGTVANDSGSVLLVLGVIYLAVVAGFYWATPLDAP